MNRKPKGRKCQDSLDEEDSMELEDGSEELGDDDLLCVLAEINVLLKEWFAAWQKRNLQLKTESI